MHSVMHIAPHPNRFATISLVDEMIVGSRGHSTHVRATQSLGTSTVQGAQGEWSASVKHVKGGAIYSASSHRTEPVWRIEFEARGSSI
ncbi:MAG: hypothetical protein EBU62_06930 [Proteobacteria bacterium]|nr:hypothetical protein [Pseudomonadota bacterium]NBQ31979.1 hypothetical protein [Pseudomonadota bacterium]NCV21362.1 hypothetical protein [Chloroflexota bacterium]NDF38282.1 hypothetical protein [Pseudomonadota bacterium]